MTTAVSFDRLRVALEQMHHFGRHGAGEEIPLGGDDHNALTGEIAAALLEVLTAAGLDARARSHSAT